MADSRIPVQAVLELVRDRFSVETIRRDFYPSLEPDDIKACVQYAVDLVAGEEIHLAAA